MKRLIFNLLLASVACTAFAQYGTVKVTANDGNVYKFGWDELSSIQFWSNNTIAFLPNVEFPLSPLAQFNESDISKIEFSDKWDSPTSAVNSVYSSLYEATASPFCTFYYASLLASDDMLGGGFPNDRFTSTYDLIANNGVNMTLYFWQARYRGINKANQVLQMLPKCECSEAVRNQAMGEVYFLRAFYYYELASMYGNIPLITDVSVVDDLYPTQALPADTWGRILLDLKTAISLMKDEKVVNIDDKETTEPFHVDKYAAEGMLARAWLFYTGYYLGYTDAASSEPSVQLPDGSTLTKQQVIDYLKDCVNNSGYTLVPDYRNLWPYTNRFTVEDYSYTAGQGLQWVENDGNINPEALFSIKYNKMADWSTSTGYSNQYALYFGVIDYGNDYQNTFPFGHGWGAGPVVPSLYSEWNTSQMYDMRLDASIANIPLFISDAVQSTGYVNKKLIGITAKNGSEYYSSFCAPMYGETGWVSSYDNFQLNNIQNLVLLRFADVLLMLSELTGDATYMNQVRARAGLPAVSYSLANIQQERRYELAFEGVRWNDMRRWGPDYCKKALTAQLDQPYYNQGVLTTNKAILGGYAARYDATGGFFKIPEQELELNPNLVQNPGWDTTESEFFGLPTLYEDMLAILNSGNTSTWTWDIEGNISSSYPEAAWGNMGYQGAKSKYPAERMGSVWWGCTPEDLVGVIQHSDTGVPTGEESRDAYMTFSADGNIKKYIPDGTCIAEGTYDIDTSTFDPYWKFGDLTTTAGTILFPFQINGSGYKPTSFEIVNFSPERFVLVYATPNTGGWGEATWWAFKKK